MKAEPSLMPLSMTEVVKLITSKQLRFTTQQARDFIEKHTIQLFRPVEPPRATLRKLSLRLSELAPFLNPKADPETVAALSSANETVQIGSKDFFDAGTHYLHTIGSFLIKHEIKIYCRLQGVPGVIQHVCSPHTGLLFMDFIKGVDLSNLSEGQLPPIALRQLYTLLEQIHKRHVIHFDIGHDSEEHFWGRDCNILWNEQEQCIYLIDFAGSLSNVWPQALFNKLALHDRLALAKIKRRFFPQEPILENEIPSDKDKRFFKRLGKL